MGLYRGSSSYARGLERLWSEGTLTGLGSEALLERYLATGDEAAFEALVAQHGPMVLGLCRRMLADPRDVEDAFQAVFMILARKGGRVRNRNRLASWLYGVAYKVAARARDQAARSRARETPITELEDGRIGQVSLLDQVGPALDQELSRLPEKYRSALLLCYLKGRTHDQAAQELACPVGTVRSRLARGRDLLRKRLVERGCAPAVAILDGGSIRWAGEVVSAALLARTTRAAVAFGSYQSAPAAAGAVALTQGVIMSMKIASLKLATVAIVMGGVAVSAGGMAAARLAGGTPAQPPPAAKNQPPVKVQTHPRSLEERIASIESKFDALLSRSDAPREANPISSPPSRDAESVAGMDSMMADFATRRAIREAEARLKLALRSFKQWRKTPGSLREEPREKGLLAIADLQGFEDGFAVRFGMVRERIQSCNRDQSRALEARERALAIVKRERKLDNPSAEEIVKLVEAGWNHSRADADLLSALSWVEANRNEIESLKRVSEGLKELCKRIDEMISTGSVFDEPDPPMTPRPGLDAAEPEAPAKP